MRPTSDPGRDEPRPHRVTVTGASGSLAADVLPALSALGHDLHGFDRVESSTAATSAAMQTFTRAGLDESERLDEALVGQDAVLHLAGIPLEYRWPDLSRVNIDGTRAVLESARRAGVRRIVLASSIHAAGRVPIPIRGSIVPDDVHARPSNLYGVTKAAVEALGSYYADAHGLEVTCLRIASRAARPANQRMLSTWLSPADAVGLFHAALTTDSSGFRLVWGVSDNTRRWLSTEGGASIGFNPNCNAEHYVDEVPPDTAKAVYWNATYIGGTFCSPTPPWWGPPAEAPDPPPGPVPDETTGNNRRSR